jgi:hypothetical protein
LVRTFGGQITSGIRFDYAGASGAK